jgi:parallel beta-helix repeat protein
LGGVSFSNCQNFRCEQVNVIGIEREYPAENGDDRPLDVDPTEPMIDSHTNGIIVTGYSGLFSSGIVSNCDVQGMSAPGIYISNSFNVDVIECRVRGGVSRATGFRVSSSKHIQLRRCRGFFNTGSGLQISHNIAKLLGRPDYPGRIHSSEGTRLEFEVYQVEGVGLPSSRQVRFLGVENPYKHRIEEIQVGEVFEPVEISDPFPGRRFSVRLIDRIPFHVAITEMKLYINFIPNYRITFDNCTSRINDEQGVEMGTELHGAVGSNINLTDITCEENLLNGITVSSAEFVSINGCTCSNNERHGIYVVDSALAERSDDDSPIETNPIFWHLTRNVRIYDSIISNNSIAGIGIRGAQSVGIDGVDMITDINVPSYNSEGCISVLPQTFQTEPSSITPTHHTERIANLRINDVNFSGTAIVQEDFISKLIGRSFAGNPNFDTEGDELLEANENAVVSDRYHLSFTGNPNGNIHAPIRSTYTDISTGTRWTKSTEEHSSLGWVLEFEFNSRPDLDDRLWQGNWGKPSEFSPIRPDFTVPPPPSFGQIQPPLTQPQPPPNWRIVKTIYQIGEIEKAEVFNLEEIRATQPQKLEEQKRVLVEQITKQKGYKIEKLAPRISSEVVTLGEQRMPVFQQLNQKDRIKIELLSPKMIPVKR